ncbi:sugar ABC transporter ATP-binding protein [Microbacterium caowuchunii]|uniref:sugar ABC transporter ATP-binding protein n=1 Tax=Microbacterium caowuchunii TaxID=2614638 RepID=UPI0012467C70|nr:sugar ABC transporter ATP-binding protein [Microbacterium caowuchunii]QEW00959.1 sugar ABC transporter ATP-binding protein [Microbacterium caowuchunii]
MPGTTDPAPPGAARIELTDIHKNYGGVRAIRHADLIVAPGEVHALVGENGAGKSTLIKILSGAERADGGTIRYDGRDVSISSTSDAIGLGVQTVYQEPQLFPELSVAENVFVGREITRAGRIDWSAQAEQMHTLLATVGLPDRVSTVPVGQLSIAEQQQVSIAKALAAEASVLILDEPSAILTDSEIEVLFAVIRRLTGTGVSVIYISHRLDELFRIADRVTVMRDGRTITTRPIAELSVRQIAELMVGGIVTASRRDDAAASRGAPVLRLESLASGDRFHGVDLQVAAGEIVGVYGLIGSGAGDVAAAVYGMVPVTEGTLWYDGGARRFANPRQAKREGISMLPANRSAQGSFAFQSIAFNITIGALGVLSAVRGWVSGRRETAIADDMIARLSIKTPSARQPISAMSGGNAQKVILARQLVQPPRLLVLAEPTQGVDIGAKEEIHRIVSGLADDGAAVLVTTSDLGEVLRISDRILVMREGRIAAEFGPDASQVQILAAAAGDERAQEAAGLAPVDADEQEGAAG